MKAKMVVVAAALVVSLGLSGSCWAAGETVPPGDQKSEPRGDIIRAEMPGIDMSNANMEGKKIEWSDLRNGHFKGANFQKATIERVQFHGGDFSDADFSGATLKWVKFVGATMPNANFTGAKLERVDFSELDEDEKDSDKPGAKEAKPTVLNGAKFTGANIQWGEFRGANAAEADFANAALERVYFSPFGHEDKENEAEAASGTAGQTGRPGAVLRSAKFSGATLNWCEFIKTDCTGADFSGAVMNRVDFGEATLVDVNMRVKSMENVGTEGASMNGMKR